jgi:Zn-dependent protease
MFFRILAEAPALGAIWIAVIFISLTVHEFSHALVGKWKGDPTAELAGRLTLNPLSHLDIWGFIPLLLFGFGWAKPVPFNPYNLKDPKWDAVAIAVAGPISNLILSAVSGIILRFMLAGGGEMTLLHVFLLLLVIINLFLFFFNLIPVHPLDGSKLIDALLTAPKWAQLRIAIATYGPQALLMAVVISIITNIDIFFFISAPAYATCDAVVGEYCAMMLVGFFL